jgi:hypothetical protein
VIEQEVDINHQFHIHIKWADGQTTVWCENQKDMHDHVEKHVELLDKDFSNFQDEEPKTFQLPDMTGIFIRESPPPKVEAQTDEEFLEQLGVTTKAPLPIVAVDVETDGGFGVSSDDEDDDSDDDEGFF